MGSPILRRIVVAISGCRAWTMERQSAQLAQTHPAKSKLPRCNALHTDRSNQQSGGHTQPHVNLVQNRPRPDLHGDPTKRQRRTALPRTPRALSTAIATLAPCDNAPRTARIALASYDTKSVASGDHRPPTSSARTTRRARAPGPTSSG